MTFEVQKNTIITFQGFSNGKFSKTKKSHYYDIYKAFEVSKLTL